MIYVDETFFWSGTISSKAKKWGRTWCHLWCDFGEEEFLHKLALLIGLRREWYQKHPVLNHYDLVPSKRKAAIEAGAIPKKLDEWLHLEIKKGTIRNIKKSQEGNLNEKNTTLRTVHQG